MSAVLRKFVAAFLAALIFVVPAAAGNRVIIGSGGGGGEAATYTGDKTIAGTVTVDEVLGTEIVVDGGFTDTANWTEGAGWAIVGGVMVHTAGTGTLVPAVALVPAIGTTYKISYAVSAWTVAGTAISFGGVSFQTNTKPTADGTITAYVTAITTGSLTFTPLDAGRFSIDNVSIKAVTSKLQGSPGPLVVSKAFSGVGSTEATAIFNGHSVSAIGDKAVLKLNMTGAVSGSERKDFIDGWYSLAGGRTFNVTAAGNVWTKSSISVGGSLETFPVGQFGPYGTSFSLITFPGDEGIALFSSFGDNALNRGWIFAPYEAGTEQTASNVVQDYVQIKAELKQTGTAGSNALAIRVSETTLGSGAQNLIYASTYAANDADPFAGAETVRFTVSNTGNVDQAGYSIGNGPIYGSMHINGTASITEALSGTTPVQIIDANFDCGPLVATHVTCVADSGNLDIVTAGTYDIALNMSFAVSTGTEVMTCSVYKEGVVLNSVAFHRTSSASYGVAGARSIVAVSANDTLTVKCNIADASTPNLLIEHMQLVAVRLGD